MLKEEFSVPPLLYKSNCSHGNKENKSFLFNFILIFQATWRSKGIYLNRICKMIDMVTKSRDNSVPSPSYTTSLLTFPPNPDHSVSGHGLTASLIRTSDKNHQGATCKERRLGTRSPGKDKLMAHCPFQMPCIVVDRPERGIQSKSEPTRLVDWSFSSTFTPSSSPQLLLAATALVILCRSTAVKAKAFIVRLVCPFIRLLCVRIAPEEC